jgi:choline transport protein
MDQISIAEPGQHSVSAKIQADQDAIELAVITGYEQQMVRRWGLQKVIGMALGNASTWAFAGAGLTLVINEGGPAAALYGFLLVSVFTFCIAASIAELVSVYPTSGGPYYWTARLAPPKWASFLSLLTGYANCMSWICACASVVSTNAIQIFGFVVIAKPQFDIKQWMLYCLFLFFMLFSMMFTMFLYPLVPYINKWLIYWSQIAMLVCIITMLVTSRGQFSSNKFVWAEYVNNTGWNNVLCFITGLVNSAFSYGSLDCSVHLAEEAIRPEKNIPIAISAQMGVSFLQGFLFSIVMYYCIRDLDQILTATVPSAELFLQAMNGSVGGAVVLQLMVVSVLICVNLESQINATRMVWSFSRDGAFPGSKWLSKVHPKLLVPVNAQIAVNVIVFLLGFLYLFAGAAYNALVGSSFILAYVAYLIPIVSLVARGRKFEKPGPFYMRKYGIFVNVASIGWLTVFIVFWQFPFFLPVIGHVQQNMNWTVVVVCGIMILASAWWFVGGRKQYNVSIGTAVVDESVRVHEAPGTPVEKREK